MPVLLDRPRTAPWPRLAAVVLAGLLLAPGGCLNLDLPYAPDGGVPPSLKVLAPQPGDTVTLTSIVAVASDSVGGAPTVTLNCRPPDGGAAAQVQVYTWVGPPYQAVVDFTRCEKLAGQSADAGTGPMQLHVESFLTGGPKAQVDVPVLLDSSAANLLVTYPPSVQPLSRFEVVVVPIDRTLAADPEVALDGTPADSVTFQTLGDGGPSYRAVFQSAPGLGIDQYRGPFPNPLTGQPPLPIEVLTETSRTAQLTIDAKAFNGNPTHLDRAVDLSRVVWDRSIPGRPLTSVSSASVADPVPVLSGLVLPLATDDLNPTPTSRWIPGLMGAADGVYTPFDPSILPGGLDGGFLASGINAAGQTLFAAGIRNLTQVALAPVPGTHAPLAPAAFPTTVLTPLTPVGAFLCLPDSVSGVSQTGCPNADSLLCIDPGLGRPTMSGTSGPIVGFNPPATGAVAGAGGTYLAPATAGCDMAWVMGTFASGTMTFQSRNDPDPNATVRVCAFQSVDREFPLGDGSVVVALTSFCTGPGTNEFPVLRVSAGGIILGSYIVARGAPAPVRPNVVAALVDGRVVTLENQAPYSVFKLWSLGKTAPDAVALIPGLYEYDDSSALPSLGRNIVAAADGSLAVLLSGAPLGVGVLAFGPGLQPRWFYFYPRLTAPAAQRLFGASDLGQLYLLDGTNNHIAALTLNHGGDAGTGGGPDGGSPDGGVDGGTPCGPANGTVVVHSANINASETWAGDGVTHSVPNSISINGPATVTVQPCAIVSLAQNASITVNASGTLLSAGTSATRSVTFQRSVGNQPWGILRGTSTTAATGFIELHWTTLSGGGAFGGQYHNPAIAMAGFGYSSLPTPMLRVDNVVIDGPQGVGVYFDGNAAFTSDSQSLTIQNAPDYVFEMTMMSVGSVPSGSYTNGNPLPVVQVDVGPNANVFADMTIHNRLPVRIPTGGLTVAPPPAGPFTPVTLTVEAGVEIRFPKPSPTTPGARVIFGTNGNPPNNQVGRLVALGTAAAPIVFTSGEATPAAGDWVGLWLNTATGSQLDHVVIEYAGAPSGIVSANCKLSGAPDQAALFVGDFSTQYVPPANLITNSLIQNSAGFGIDAMWQAPTFNAPDLTATNVFQNNDNCAQTYNALTSGSCPVGGGCTAF